MIRLWALAAALACQLALAQANGRLQIHYMDVGQGDGAMLISPQGQVVMFDSGALEDCTKPVAYLENLGVDQIDHHINSHFHADHMGCIDDVFSHVTLRGKAYDRGGSYNSKSFRDYDAKFGPQREAATPGKTITLDASSASPVKITFVAVNGDGVTTDNENDLSVVTVVEFGQFRTEFGGDLSGQDTGTYKDIETSVASKVGRIDVYKVYHHCSRYSTNKT